MGACLTTSKSKFDPNQHRHVRDFAYSQTTKSLFYHETAWYFGETHDNVLTNHLNKYNICAVKEIILSYLQYSKHSNYHTYIHKYNTPLNDNYEGVSQTWLNNKTTGKYNYIKLVMLGDSGVGKSCITIRFVIDNFVDEYDSTIEDCYIKQFALNVAKRDYDSYDPINPNNDIDIQNIRLEILDTVGDDYMPMSDHYYREGKIFLLVFDVMNKSSFESIKNEALKILRAKDDDNYDFLIMLVGNKCDLRDENDYDYELDTYTKPVDMNEVNEWISSNQIPYVETSAKYGKNICFLYRQSIYEYYEQTRHIDTAKPKKNIQYGRPYYLNNSFLTAKTKLIQQCENEWTLNTREMDINFEKINEREIRENYEFWLKQGVEEYVAIASFSRFALDLMSLGAPSFLLELTQKAILDEIRHSKIAFDIANIYLCEISNKCVNPSEFERHSIDIDGDCYRILSDTLNGGCFNECVSALKSAKQSIVYKYDNLQPINKLLYSIAIDEVRHCSLAWVSVLWILNNNNVNVSNIDDT
eukprot:446810_1